MDKNILIANPGSASRKYALYHGQECLATLHFEYVDNKPYCEISVAGAAKRAVEIDITDITEAAGECERILRDQDVLKDEQKIDAAAIRVVAPSRYFQQDRIVDDQVIAEMEKIQARAPLHVGSSLSEVKYLRHIDQDLPLVIISDSSFHATRPIESFRYAVDVELQDKLDLGRFGYHGISVSSIVEIMKRENILPEKLIVAHLGGGASISAVVNGQSIDNSMGYTPNTGLMMATRCGDIDPSVIFALKKELALDDEAMERYLNKQAGFIGLSKVSDDMRLVIEADEKGDERAIVANKTYRYMMVKTIGAMAAAMNGVDAIVFTATVGERGAEVREPICEMLTYLGFKIDHDKNWSLEKTTKIANLAQTDSKPIYMIKTDELGEMARRAAEIL
ncbi:MAG: hypothetical protein Q3996_03085 [Candidatus Saccharibacteria bacterium]|nr:hypothetical protein [Candidatus Saccharibacteria bacterium]